jgi:cell division protein FtsQ
MARKASPTISQEELYPPSAPYARQELDDARLVDLDVDEESPFLRGQKRIPARRSSLPKKAANRLIWISLAAAVVCIATVAASAFYRYGERSWRFRVDSSDNIEITGTQNVTKGQIMEVMGADMGRNVFFIPLAQQKAQLEQIPWVESASVMRFVPNRLKVEIHERTPVAFARVGPRISLIDASGALMELTSTKKYSFPVILGMNAGEPLSTRAPRMKVYNELARELDSGGAHYSQDLSEVDLSDLEDVKVRVSDPSGEVLVHLGASDYLRRYKIYVSHAREWRQQFDKLESVDLRYENQIIVNPDLEGTAKRAALSPAAAKTAIAAGVKPAALISKLGPHDRVIPKPAFELPEKKSEAKSAGNKAVKKIWVRAKPRTAHRRTAKSRAAAANKPVSKVVAAPSLAKPAAGGAQKPSPAIAKGQGSAGPGE